MAIISGSENKQLSWIPRETISEVERMDQMEDLKIRLIIFKEKGISFHFSEIDCVIKISSAVLNIDRDCKNIFFQFWS